MDDFAGFAYLVILIAENFKQQLQPLSGNDRCLVLIGRMIRLSRFCTSFSFLIITKAKQKSFGYRSPPLEARAIASTRWHFCTNCSQWPAVAYEEVKNPEHPPTDGLCPECLEKRKRKSCRWWEEIGKQPELNF